MWRASMTESASDLERARLAEVVQSTYAYLPASLLGYLAGVGVVATLYWGIAPTSLLAPWIGAFVLMCLVRLIVAHRYRRAAPQTLAQWRTWCWRSNLGSLSAGALWGLTGWLFYGQGTDPQSMALQQTGLILIVYTFCVVAITVLSIQLPVYLAFATLALAPLVARITLAGDAYRYQLAAELVFIASLTVLFANTYRQTLQRVIELKVEGDQLAARLRVETAAADAARREAEVANRAKTQFFTAASHDLRQPLHAMGLFAEALRQRVHDPAVAQLVNSINESVDALEGLFSELLDITLIDSGHVPVEPEHFAMGDLLRKLRLHFEPSAFEKGLHLRLRGAGHVVHADPVLVERILRNLVSNAIRYTDDGTVLVGCRRRGNRVLLQVWDTGRGIDLAEQARVFDEFYQVPGQGVSDPEQRRGLGLGLAIVKRLADLMEAPLSLRSEPGRGTVFSLELPVGRAPRAAGALPSAKRPRDITLNDRRIVVVEDEPAVRAGLEVLLRGWGAEIESFDSVAASQAWAEAAPQEHPRPDLLIVDYRLEDGRTGLDAIRVLRSRFGASLPAILVTGSTMTGHDREAQEHDFHLLIKPVLPNKLRAMIAFKLGVKA
jgi:signal transduction histidine kinase